MQLAHINIEPYKSSFQMTLDSSMSSEQKFSEMAKVFELLIEDLSDIQAVRFTTLFSRLSYLKNKLEIDSKLLWLSHYLRRVIEEKELELDSEQKIELASYVLEGFFNNLSAQEFRREIPKFLIAKPKDTSLYLNHCFGIGYQSHAGYLFIPEHIADSEWKLINLSEEQEMQISRILYLEEHFIHLTLLDVHFDELNQTLRARAFVIEPNYLIDVTSIAECFKPNGRLPQNYLLKKYVAVNKSMALMMGNAANQFLDKLIYKPEEEFKTLMLELFQRDPLPFLLVDDRDIRKFTTDARKHFKSISEVLQRQLQSIGVDVNNSYTEPSFLSNIYGLQGRLDVLHQSSDKKLQNIIELKSGSAYKPNTYGISVNHYTQTLLYDLMVNSSFGKSVKVSNYILYSKLEKEQLRFAPKAVKHQYNALMLRNDLIYIEKLLQNLDKEPAFEQFMNIINAGGNTFDNFSKRDLTILKERLAELNEIERLYFRSYTAFIAREHAIAKVGMHGIHKSNGLAGLWLDPLSEKIEHFSVLSHLTIFQNNSNDDDPIIIFNKSPKSNTLSRFRVGDIIVLYPWHEQQESPLKNQVFKSTIVELDSNFVKVRLRNRQYNQSLFKEFKYWNIEADLLDSGYTRLYQNLFDWMGIPKRTRSLFLGLEAPESADESNIQLSKFKMTDAQVEVVAKILKSKDYFLLWGPPGTGKTSVIIKELARYYSSIQSATLFLAYTNRAVDEICEAIHSISDSERNYSFIRIGSRYSTSEKFRHQLFSERSKACKTRSSLNSLIAEENLFVATVSSILGKKEIFNLKSFDTIIIDEASQLLEPTILSLLSKAKKIVMIGDHKQLPAVVQQSASQSEVKFEDLAKELDLMNLRNSLFERLYERAMKNGWEDNFDKLIAQGRMHQRIMKFSDENFYNGNLTALGIIDRLFVEKRLNSSEELVNQILNNRVVFINVDASDHLAHKTNRHEAEAVEKIVHAFSRTDILAQESLGIITPFRAQIALINERLAASALEEAITIDTVERYQGAARDHIIFSMCIKSDSLKKNDSASEKEIRHKFNVALTRAKESLTIIGNKTLMSETKLYADWIEQAFELKIDQV